MTRINTLPQMGKLYQLFSQDRDIIYIILIMTRINTLPQIGVYISHAANLLHVKWTRGSRRNLVKISTH